MATLLGNAVIRVRADTTGFEGEAKSGVMSGVKKIGALAATVLGGAMAVGLKGAIGEASNLEQSMGAIDAVFKDNSKTVKAWAAQAAQASGLSKNEFGELATTLGAMLKNKGIEDFSGQTKKLIDLGGDLAAQFGGSTKEAVEAVSSLMRGESDPIERYGVSINETAINARLAADGLGDLEGAALEQAKAQARLAILMEQTTDAQGAFARESGTAANSQQKLNAAWDNTKASLGQAFLPMLGKVADTVTGKVLPAIDLLRTGDYQSGMFGDSISEDSKYVDVLFKIRDAFVGVRDTFKVLFSGDFSSGMFGGKYEEDSKYIDFLFTLRETFASVWGSVKTIVGNLLQVVKELGPVLGAAFGSGLLAVVSALSPLLKDVASWLAKNKEVVLTLVAGWVAYGLATKAWAAYGLVAAGVQKAMTVAQMGLNAAMRANPIGFVVTALTALAAAAVYAWNNSETFREVVTGAWKAVQEGAAWMWNNVLKPTFDALVVGWNAVASGVQWAWTNVLKPVWDLLSSVVTTLWSSVLSPIFGLMWSVFSATASGISAVWSGILKPVFDAVWNVVSFLWNNVLSPIFTAIGSAWSGLVSGMKWAWDNVLAPVFGFFGDTVNGIKSTFDTAVEGIGKAWEGLKSLVAAPIKWVIDTVWNNGLLAAWNWVNNLWDGDDVSPFDVNKIAFASGGIMPGYTPGRDVHKFFSPTGGLLELSGGEAIMRPEVTKALGADGVEALNAAARSGGPSAVGQALQGLFDHRAASFADGGVWEVPGWLRPLVSDDIEKTLDDIGKNKVFKMTADIIGGSASKVWALLKSQVDKLVHDPSQNVNDYGLQGADGKVFGSAIPHAAGSGLGTSYATIAGRVMQAFPGTRLTSGKRNTPDAHGRGKAADLVFGPSPQPNGNSTMGVIKYWLDQNFRGQLYELIYNGVGGNLAPNLKNSSPLAYSPATQAQHRNHIHAAVYDQGGVLEPGLTMARNHTGGPEAILTAEQWAAVYAAASNDGPLVDTIQIYPTSDNAREIVEETIFELRKLKRGARV